MTKLHEKPSASKENIQHFKKCNIINFVLCLWVIFALLAPDPDSEF
jgi:hypothetical protein